MKFRPNNRAVIVSQISSFPDQDTKPVTTAVNLWSGYLNRTVALTVVLPAAYAHASGPAPELVIFQDGQDFTALRLAATMEFLLSEGSIGPAIVVGVHAGENRIHEYGIAARADYKGRGSRAGLYTRFILEELLPFLRIQYRLSPRRPAIAGFSLGGLTALDIAWNHPDVFGKAGIFSGSLWWRQKPAGKEYRDSDRIMHHLISATPRKPDVELWFQTGTHDETSDRDHDGVIDSIADTLDCIAELERKGFRWQEDVRYLEVESGEHNPTTWRKVLPDFLKWTNGAQLK